MLRPLIFAFVFVLPLYWVWIFEMILNLKLPLLINSIFGLLSLYIFLFIPSSYRFKFGFFVGLFWFYWVGFSFVYFGFTYLVPLISILVACIYMLIFAIALWFSNPFYRLSTLLCLSFIHPFGFDWMKIDSFFAYSYFGVSKIDLFLLALSIIICVLSYQASKRAKFLYYPIASFFIICALYTSPSSLALVLDRVDVLHTNFSQDLKWQRDNALKNTMFQVALIRSSLQEGNKLIILPETAFPFVLERSAYFQILKDLSLQGTLVVGAMREKEGRLYNSTYIFQNGQVSIFDKVILAPFGEKIPLPDFLAKPLERIFLGDGAPRFSASKEFGTFSYQGFRIKSVICYEGTSQKTYEDAPPYLVVISNNAWFPHTIEPALQKNLMQYYAKLYQTVILHSSNGSPSFVIFP